MEFTNEQLIQVINRKPISNTYPYSEGKKGEIEDFLKRVVDDIKKSSVVKAEADFNHYGSGYASYVDVFCYKRDGSSITDSKNCIETEGIAVYLSRLAPVAVFGKEKWSRSRDEKASSFGFMRPNTTETTPDGNWDEVVFVLKTKLRKHGFDILKKRYVSKELPFEAKIPTILNDNGRYQIFDAFFYWED